MTDDPDPDDDLGSDGRVPAATADDLDPRVKRVIELVYQIDGVVAAKVWAMPERVAVGVRVGNGHGAAEVIARIDAVTSSLREPGESWDFGLLDGDG